MSSITTHVLDAVLGNPAARIEVRLAKQSGSDWTTVGAGATDADGRCRTLCPNGAAGVYQLTFEVGDYFARLGRASIYPEIAIAFHVDGESSYHIPLLLSDNSYTTYRGS